MKKKLFNIFLLTIFLFLPNISYADSEEIFSLKPGLVRKKIIHKTKSGNVVINILEVDLKNKNISLKGAIPSNETIQDKTRLVNLVNRNMAYAGINANYFDVKVGNPLGLLKLNNEWVVGNIYNRAAIGFTREKKILIGKPNLKATIKVFKGIKKKKYTSEFSVNCLNTPVHIAMDLCIFDKSWGKTLELLDDEIAIQIKGSKVSGIKNESIEIPPGGYLIAGKKDLIYLKTKRRDSLGIKWEVDLPWNEAIEIIGGGPYLIKDGEVFIDDKEENLIFKNKNFYAPRTAIGIDNAEKLYLIVVDGRQPKYSVGFSLKELADFLKNYGITNAINLDGGGSTEMVIDGKIINKPSDKNERLISNALLIMYDAPSRQ